MPPPRLAMLLAALLSFVPAMHARAAVEDDAPSRRPAHVTKPKRRAKVMEQSGRERVGIGGHAPGGRDRVPAVSIGSPSAGHLEHGAHLDTSATIRVVPAYQRGDVRWGHPELTHLLERASRAVARRFPGAVLDVGDLSRKNGGDLMRHHSHESGRDADVAFFVTDARGRPYHASTFVRFDGGLRSVNAPGAHLDEARTWAFVQAILTDPSAHVSHVFVAEPIRQRLLAYARAHGVSHPLWMRAATTLMQPSDSEAHDDHMHVRISCPGSSRSVCQEVATRVVHRPRVVARVGARRPSVLTTPPRTPPPSGTASQRRPPPLDRVGDFGDDMGPLARARLLR